MEYEDIGPQPNRRPIYTIPRTCTPRPDKTFYPNLSLALQDWILRDIYLDVAHDVEEEESDVEKEVIVE